MKPALVHPQTSQQVVVDVSSAGFPSPASPAFAPAVASAERVPLYSRVNLSASPVVPPQAMMMNGPMPSQQHVFVPQMSQNPMTNDVTTSLAQMHLQHQFNANDVPSTLRSSAPVFQPGSGVVSVAAEKQMPNMLQNYMQPTAGSYYYDSAAQQQDAYQAPEPTPGIPYHPHVDHGQSATSSTLDYLYAYQGPSSNIAHLKPRGAGIATYFVSHELRAELYGRYRASCAGINPGTFPDMPTQIESYTNLYPLEQITKGNSPAAQNDPAKPSVLNCVSTVYRATGSKDGYLYALRRIHGVRLTSTKCTSIIDMWKKSVSHSNVVTLRDVFTTAAFPGDRSLVFVYDYHAGAQTLQMRHFSHTVNGMASQPPVGAINISPGGLLPEPLIWCYIVQLCSALRSIHSVGLAARTLDLTKVLIVGRSKLMVNGCCIPDVLTFDRTQENPSAVTQHYQQEDLSALGRVILALSCNSLVPRTARIDYLNPSFDVVARHYSSDLNNLIRYLLVPQPQRARSVNDLMPMIGARFFSQLDAAQMRCDMLENELAKEVENGRLFRLLCKLGTINERPELQLDPEWSETGDRYLLKLFRDYLFHQVTDDGRPWLDMAHIVSTLNRMDAGAPDRIALMSRDQQNTLVVSYADLKRCLEVSFAEVANRQAIAVSSGVVADPTAIPTTLPPQ